jgi:hypothetical protein
MTDSPTARSEGLTTAKPDLGGFGFEHDYYYEAHFFIFFDVFL